MHNLNNTVVGGAAYWLKTWAAINGQLQVQTLLWVIHKLITP